MTRSCLVWNVQCPMCGIDTCIYYKIKYLLFFFNLRRILLAYFFHLTQYLLQRYIIIKNDNDILYDITRV